MVDVVGEVVLVVGDEVRVVGETEGAVDGLFEGDKVATVGDKVGIGFIGHRGIPLCI